MRILLIEDDALLGDGLRVGLRQNGFLVDWVRSGDVAQREWLAAPTSYDAVVLDLGLPGRDGMAVLAAARSAGLQTPTLILTARDALDSRVAGLDGGADDYVLKPVDLAELAARLRALVRRAAGQAQDRLMVHDVQLDPKTHVVTRSGQAVDLSAREFDLLHALMRRPGQVLSREQLQKQIYNWGHEVESNAVEVHVHHLRRKLGPGVVETVRGVGYRVCTKAAT